MTSIEEATVTLVKSDPTFASLCAGGLHPSRIPNEAPLPAARFFTVSDVALQVSDGPDAAHRVRIQFDIIADSWRAPKNIDAALLAVLCPSPNVRRTVGEVVIDGVLPDIGRERYEPNTGSFMFSRDVVVWGAQEAAA